ncbi:homoserine kinase [Aurantiacibacter aquimixticola]|uniref:Homoserine kinase n=1 Tax=Aurantiacibacter aquimixticola TaxID=1958945 RepID=A0A419RTE5_9SPHN|nr:homoserine kinase [Aurantiacibacter aquimixticola]RJY09046.1 homoserine kinase [Aurantiacibacter aquimixticola]
MAVYTQLSAETLADLIAHYDVGELVSAKGIAEGVSNSNWLIETSGGEAGSRFILTMYERRIDVADLPFFLGLLDHLSAMDAPVPRTIHDRDGSAWREVAGKSVALIEFLPGVSVDRPTAAQAENIGAVLAHMHEAARNFPQQRSNDLGPDISASVLRACGVDALAQIDTKLPSAVAEAERIAGEWPGALPQSVIHADLFPDNVLMLGDQVSGLIDFYFACNDMMAYDLAVTHAAWSFAEDGRKYRPEIGQALMQGYQSVRVLSDAEHDALPLLAQGAAMRFVSSRAHDWTETPADALVTRKDPMDFMHRFHFYRDFGTEVFG